ncbi:MAG: GlcNAc-transferase family protein, partial [bacterium]
MSIFISIASYRDPELIRTIKSAIDNAAYPEEL